MANYSLKEMPDVRKTGKRTVYPKMETYSQKSLDDLVKYIKQIGTPYDSGTIKGVVSTLTEAAVSWLSNGHTVKIDGLGCFSLSLQFVDEKGNEMKDEKDRMTYRHVEVKSLNFKPDEELVRTLREVTDLTRSEGGVVALRKERYTKDERLKRAKQHIEKHGFITLTEYANLNGLSRSVASRELKTWETDPLSSIKAKGTAPHKSWVLRTS